MTDIFKQINEITGMYALSAVKKDFATVSFEGLLVPSENYVNPYNRVALVVSGQVRRNHKKGTAEHVAFQFQGAFTSIDDSGITFHGPNEGEEAATRRYGAFEAFIRERHPMMPTLEQVEAWSQMNGVHPDLW